MYMINDHYKKKEHDYFAYNALTQHAVATKQQMDYQ